MFERFNYKTGIELIEKARALGLELPYTEDISPLLNQATMDGIILPNRMVVQPMEGYDSEADGSPSMLTKRRYLRYASGGSGMIWFEAVSVSPEGRSNPRQLWINKDNYASFASLNEEVRKSASLIRINPFLIIQLTHSGRYSKPIGQPKPLVAAPNKIIDRSAPCVLSDDELRKIQDQFVSAARLAADSGFNAIDIKACHGYLIIDLLAAKSRQKSLYGGKGPVKRFRFLLETIDRIKSDVPGIIVTTRLNISDLYRGGFGVDKSGNPDFKEPIMLVKELKHRGVRLINISMGNPYFNPHITRPFDTPLPGQSFPEQHPLEGVINMINGTSLFQKEFPEISFVGSAYSYLRHFAPHVGAAVIRNGDASFIGFGRSSFAYPSLPLDLVRKGKADRNKVCISCSGCTRLIKNMRPGGCVIRDREIYGKELKNLINGK